MSGSASVRPHGRSPHDLSERYEVVKKLGRGGMGEVFLAWKLGMDGEHLKLVVLKRVLPHLADEEKATEQFMAEMAVAATLEHRNIVRVADWGRFHGSNCFEMELIQGMSVDDLLKHRSPAPETGVIGTLPVVDAAWIAMQVCQGLAYAHTKARSGHAGVVHRDISPDNLMVDVDGEVKIADWGVAKALMSSDGKATSTQNAIGKQHYMPPEQWAGHALDGRADLYALGVSLVKMVSGKQVFSTRDNEGILQFIQRVVTGDRPHARDLLPDAPEAFQQLVEQMLAKDPRHRPSSAQALVEPFAQVARELGGDLYSVQRAFASRVREHHAQGKLTEPSLDAPEMEVPPESAKRRIETLDDASQPPPSTSTTGPLDAEPSPPPTTARLPEAAPTSPTAPEPLASPASSPEQVSDGGARAHGASRRTRFFAAIGASTLVLTGLLAGSAAFFLAGRGDAPETPVSSPPSPAPPPAASGADGMQGATGVPTGASSPRVDSEEREAPALEAPLADGPPATEVASAEETSLPGITADPTPAEEEPTTAAAEPGTIRVVVVPLGDVRLDGRPIEVRRPYRVSPGRHRIVATYAGQRMARVVDIEPGERKQVVIRFDSGSGR